MKSTTLTPAPSASPSNVSLSGFTRPGLEAWFADKGVPAYRARQVWRWFHAACAVSYSQMTDLPRDLRAMLEAALPLCATAVAAVHTSSDGSEKRLIRCADGELVETVWLPMEEHATVCVSTQAGCAIQCAFCASGATGLARNLTAAEMVEQVWHAQSAHSRSAVNNIVFMGMGEPLLNRASLGTAIEILHDPAGMHIGMRRMTVSTVGVVRGIRDMSETLPQVNLAVSLHAADDATRKKLIPHCPTGLGMLMDALRVYHARTHRRITFEYVLLRGVNDGFDHAAALAAYVRRVPSNVNLIPFNAVAGVPFVAPEPGRIRAFASVLEKRKVPVVVRQRKGDDIAAACGQLRRACTR